MFLMWGERVKLMKLWVKWQPFQVCLHIPPVNWGNPEVNPVSLQSVADNPGMPTSDLFEMLVELFGMPPFLWFSFQFPFFIVHFHGSITRPIILFSFYLFFFIATQDRRKKKNTGDIHLIYGRLSAFLIRMLFSKSTCQWHTIKTAFLIRIFMQWRYFSLMEIYKCELTLWVRKKRSAWGVSFRLIVSFLKIFIIDLENGVCSWILWKSN